MLFGVGVLFCTLYSVACGLALTDKLPRLGKIVLITRIFAFVCSKEFSIYWVLRKGCVIMLLQSLDLPYNYSVSMDSIKILLIYYQHKPIFFRRSACDLTLCLPVPSADNLGKQFGPRSGPTIRRA